MRLDDLLALEPELTTKVVARNIQIKASVVSEDERETAACGSCSTTATPSVTPSRRQVATSSSCMARRSALA